MWPANNAAPPKIETACAAAFAARMSDPYVLHLQILTTTSVGEQQVADKVQLMLISTADTSKVMRQSTKRGLFNALDIGSMWLQDANEAQH